MLQMPFFWKSNIDFCNSIVTGLKHIQTNDASFIRQLNGRLNALRKIAVNATFKTCLMAANAVFISVLSRPPERTGPFDHILTNWLPYGESITEYDQS